MRDLGIVKKEGGSRMGNGQASVRRPLGVKAAIGVWHIWCGGGWHDDVLFKLEKTVAVDELH
jgi:hypothetical protein